MKKYNDKEVIESLGLPMITCFDDLVMNVRLSRKLVYWITSSKENGKYITYKIPKRGNTEREINAPVLSVKIMQRWILENILYKIKTSPYSYGFEKGQKGSPLVRCAEEHKKNLFVLKMDLKNFYPSVSREQVYFEFINIGYNTEVAHLLTNACLYENHLPQGAVTSAYLANLILKKLDARISGYCNKRDIVYTRYADDLIFSCDNRDLLRKIVGMINKIVVDEGFVLNSKKTVFMTPKCHKRVLGITINDNMIKAPKSLKRMVRSMIHYQIATGDYSLLQQVQGYIAYITSIENGYKNKIIQYIENLIESELCLFPEIVDAYNKNKIFHELPDMQNKKACDFVNFGDEDTYCSMIYYEHENYLISKGIINPKPKNIMDVDELFGFEE